LGRLFCATQTLHASLFLFFSLGLRVSGLRVGFRLRLLSRIGLGFGFGLGLGLGLGLGFGFGFGFGSSI
jgi:hypothetical protein